MAPESQLSPSRAMLSSLAWIAGFIIACSATIDYQCWNFKSTDEIRDLYLKQVNALRQQIAQGQALCKNASCPQGKTIYRMETVKNWWDVVRTEGLDANPVNKDGLESFAALAHAKATRIGCAQKNCNGVLYLACAIFDKAPEKNQPIYEVGKGCTAATDCTTFAGSRCNTGTNLCVAGYIDPAATTSTAPTSPTTPTASPTTTDTTASTSTTGSTAPTTITASGSTMSTVPPGETTICPNNGHISTDAIRNIYLDLHNLHRSNLARGLVTNGFTHAPARQASKMIKLKYNCTAETSAFAWAQQCKDEDSHTQGVSENRYTFPNRNLDMTVIARRASNRWWEEITTKGMSQEDLNIFYSRLGVSHYARMAWDSTQSFGCAAFKCPNFINAVCHYNGGGVEGGQIYKMGPACRRCSTIGASRCEEGLCVL